MGSDEKECKIVDIVVAEGNWKTDYQEVSSRNSVPGRAKEVECIAFVRPSQAKGHPPGEGVAGPGGEEGVGGEHVGQPAQYLQQLAEEPEKEY